jgi:hypothetical protein
MEPRNFQSGAAVSAPTAPVTPSNGYATNGNPGTGTPATQPGAFWFHKIGEELRAVIVAAGLTPNDTDLTQLTKSLLSIYLDKSVAGAIDVTLTAAESNYHIIDVGGAITANINVIVPSAPGKWTFNNSTTGAFTLTVKTSAGTGIALAQGSALEMWSDGINVYSSVSGISTVPAGTLIPFAGATPPAGYLACPSSATNISRTTYAALFNAIGVLWGAGDGTTTFGIPFFADGQVPVAVGIGTVGQNTAGAMPAHTHNYNQPSFIRTAGGGADTCGTTSSVATSSTGTGANVLPAGNRVQFCVKY